MSESQLVNAIIRRCWFERNWLTIDRANSGARRFTDKNGESGYIRGHKAGTPDLVGFFAPLGRYLGIEVKLPGKKQQESQIAFEADVIAKGGIYRLVHSLDELEVIFSEIKPRVSQ